MSKKFKVGDEVKIAKSRPHFSTALVGRTGIVKEVKTKNNSSFDYGVQMNGTGYSYNFFEDELELINQESPQDEVIGEMAELGLSIGKLVDEKQKAYGNSVDQTFDLMKIYLKKWRNEDGTYTIPESLLQHVLLMVRIIDKQNRIFNNPDQDLMEENTYKDITGYGLIGTKMGR